MTGKSSLGESIQRIYNEKCRTQPKLSACELVLVPEEGDSSLVATYLKRSNGFEALLGLETLQLAQLVSKTEVVLSSVFARSPHAFIVDTKQWPDPNAWPKNWKELAQRKNVAFIQDPRISAVGIGWLKAIFSLQLIDKAHAKALTKQSFPSWSISYAAFQRGEAPLVWSYQSSEAYHRCEEKTDRYRVLPLEEGYPVQEEHAVIPGKILSAEAKLFMEVVMSPEVQKLIPTTNWMWPAATETAMPECYRQVGAVKTVKGDPASDSARLQEWMDQWSL